MNGSLRIGPSPVITSEIQQVLTYAAQRLDILEARLMALNDSIANLTAAVNDLVADVSATLTNQQKTLAAMQATVDRLSSDDAADKATIQRLNDQVAAMQAGNADAASKLDALTAAVRQADVGVDQPAPPA